MSESVTYVHVESDGVFSFNDSNGELVEIGSSPVAVDASLASFLDASPFVKRAGKAPSPKTLQDAPDDPEEA